MKEHEHHYWGEKSKYWKHDNETDPYMQGSKHFQRGHKDSKYDKGFSPPTKKHEESYRQGYDEGSKD